MFLVNEQEKNICSSHQLSPPVEKKILNKALSMGWCDRPHDKYPQRQTPPSHELWSTGWWTQQVILQSNRFPLLWWLSKSFSYQMPIFLANLNISWLIASPCFLQTRGPCTHHGLPGHRGINIAQSYFPALHNTAHAELQNHTGNSNIHINAFSVAKKNTFLPNKTPYKSLFGLSSARITPA